MVSLIDEIYKHSDDIVCGRIIACKKRQWACLRFIRDIEKQNSWRWVFDEKRAERYLDWMKLFKHSKGPLAGQQKIPAPYEKFVYGNIYGWIDCETEFRRFRRSYEQVGRKNAKSQNKGIQALYEISAFGESRAEAYVAATKKEQTRHVWGEASWLYKNSDLLKDKFVTKFDQELQSVAIIHKKSDSFFARLSKDDKKSGDGANPQFLVLDEYHLQETTEYYDLGTSGMKTRTQPLASIITTAGFDLSKPCYTVEYDYVSKILDPDNPIENDRYFVMICEADLDEDGKLVDDVSSDAARLKANPIIGDTDVGKESIAIDLQEAIDKPEKMRDFLTKTLNIWINQKPLGYMDMAKWKSCGATLKRPFPDINGRQYKVTAGLDLATRIDLASVGFEIDMGDTIAVLSHSFMPRETFEKRLKASHKIPFDRWEDEKWLTVTPGAQIEYAAILDYVVETYEKNGWRRDEACFDRHLATWLEGEMNTRKFVSVEVPQIITMLSNPTKDFKGIVYNISTEVTERKLIHDNNPILAWAISNAVTKMDHNKNIMLDKEKSSECIDPIAALMNAHFRVMVTKKKKSIYETRGIITM
jgi:phage terminase large subunit-like protein